MAASIVDGRLDVAELKRRNAKFHQYSTLRFALDGGGERTLKNAVVDNAVAARLQPGASGRFYIFNSADTRGIYGYRDPSGAAVKAYPGSNEKIGLFAMGLAIVVIILFEAFGDGTPLLALAGLVLGAIGFFFTRQSRTQVERAFAEDNRG